MLAKLVLMEEKNEVTPINEFASNMYQNSNTGLYALRSDQIEKDFEERGKMSAGATGQSYKLMDTFGQTYGTVTQSFEIPSTGGSAASGESSAGGALSNKSLLIIAGIALVFLALMPSSNSTKKKGGKK